MCSSERKTVEQFLIDLEPELQKYAKPLEDLGFSTTNLLKFLKLKDLQSLPCDLPAPHRRILLNAVEKLQSPSTKSSKIESPNVEQERNENKKRRLELNYSYEDEKMPGAFEPKTLFPDGHYSQSASKTSANEIIIQEKLQMEKQLTKLKAELAEFSSQPSELMPLALPGNRMMMVTCTNCHHRGHRKDGNKNGSACEFEPCAGYHYCGNEKLHPEFKSKKREKEKAIKNLGHKIQNKANELLQLEEFAQKNQTNFTRNVRPRLQRAFPQLYKGKEGMQKLLRDIRFLKISCDGQIPPVTENDGANLKNLIQRGMKNVSDDIGINVESVNVLKPQNEMQESATDELSDSTIDENTSQEHNFLFHNPATPMPTHMPNIAPNPFFSNMQFQQVGNMFAVPASSQNSFLNPLNFPSYVPNINLLQPSVPMYPHQFYAYQQPVLPNVNQTNCTQTQPHLELDFNQHQNTNPSNVVDTSATDEPSVTNPSSQDLISSHQSLLDLASAAMQQHR